MSVGVPLDLHPIETGLPPVPPPELDPYLDAASRCFSRYGVARTTVPDIARELRVSRTSVYRHVGTIDALARQLFARELHRLLVGIPEQLDGASTIDAIVSVAAVVITSAREHPVLVKVLADDRQLAWSLLVRQLDGVIDRTAPVVEPLLADAADRGALAAIDTGLAAEWLIRVVASLVLVPERGDLRAFLDAVVRPVLAAEARR